MTLVILKYMFKPFIKPVSVITVCISLAACYTPPDTSVSELKAGNYVLDPTHASVVWSLSHAGLSNYQARFDSIEGTLNFDPSAPTTSQLDIRIDPNSVSTGLPDFDETIATDNRYFNAEVHPDIRFTSTQINVNGDARGTVTGDLTFRGVTNPVTLDVTFNGAGKSFGHAGDTLGFSATATLDRTEFGLTYLSNFGIGKEVKLRIEAEFNEAE
ncbi:MAG: YceI family protein [Maricaulaceae bacterium]